MKDSIICRAAPKKGLTSVLALYSQPDLEDGASLSAMIAYFNGEFIEKEDIRISPDDRGFLFPDGIYEVIRSYKGKLFRY